MKKQIQDWLNGKRDRKTGLNLIAQINQSDAVRLARGNTADGNYRIFHYLLDIYRGLSPQDKANKERQVTTAPVELTPPLNDAVKQAQLDFNKLYKEMMHYRAQLFGLCDVKEKKFENEGSFVASRAELTRQVMKLHYQMEDAWEAVEFAKLHGRLPEPIVINEHPKDLYRLISNLRKNISKIKKLEPTPNRILSLEKKEKELKNLLKIYDNQL